MDYPSTPNSRYDIGETGVNSPFIMTREYQQHVDRLESDNFTLRMMLSNLQGRLEYFLNSQNISNDVQSAMIQQEKQLAQINAQTFNSFNKSGGDSSGIQQLREQLDQALRENERLQSELFERQEHSILENGAEATLEASALNAQIEKLQDKVHELEVKNQEQQDENEDLHNQIEELEKENQNQIDINNDLLEQLNTLQETNKEQENNIQQLLNEQNQNEELNKTKDDNNNKMFERIRDLESELQNSENQLQNLENQLLNEQKNREEKERIIAELENQLTEKNTEPILDYSSIEDLVKNFERATQENDLLQNKNDDLLDKYLKLNDLNEELKQKNLELDNILESILAAFEVSDSGDLITKYETLQQINKELQEQFDEVNEENHKLREENNKLREELNSLKTKDDNHNINDTFDVTSNGKENSTFIIEDTDEFNTTNNLSPKRPGPMSAQKKIDQLTAENQRLKMMIEQMKMHMEQLSRYNNFIQTESIQTSPMKYPENITKVTGQTSPIKPKFTVSNSVVGYQSNNISTSPGKNILTELQNKINNLNDQIASLQQENNNLREQIQGHTDEDLLASEPSSQESQSNSLTSLNASSIVNPNIQKLKEENEQLKLNLIEAKRSQFNSPTKDEMNRLKSENEALLNENRELKSQIDKDSNVFRTKMQLIEAKQKITQLEAANNRIKKDVNQRMNQLIQRMNTFSNQVFDILLYQMGQITKAQKLIPFILKNIAIYPLNGLKKDISLFIKDTNEMLYECQKCSKLILNSALNSIRNRSKNISLPSEDKYHLLKIRNKYVNGRNSSKDLEDDEVLPEFEVCSPIKKTNSPFKKHIDAFNKSPQSAKLAKDGKAMKRETYQRNDFDDNNQTTQFLSQKEYIFLVNQFQALINVLWAIFYEGEKAPSISELLFHSQQFKEIIQNLIHTIQAKHETIYNEYYDNYRKPGVPTMSPIVVNLIKSVREQVHTFSQNLHTDHQELLHVLDKE
ncbi:hypothetical protein TRFO_06768 [Tritrichomonas foetus]|uniref:Uncharacterized protein n=1 Tax=Tritrichomonas foetus TaxID=1144522 RepID=A0A1J4JVG9_9EUKA|nr:hypothetical protein TRFO_06768 [Tritrichomonas foetus]|eukprot:OHT03121.1 hypothetical protein TRFO_06768 [Tritrichomonas foetus]